jgi:hypothetical protein
MDSGTLRLWIKKKIAPAPASTMKAVLWSQLDFNWLQRRLKKLIGSGSYPEHDEKNDNFFFF